MNSTATDITKPRPLALDFSKGSVACAVDRKLALSFLGHCGQELGEDLSARIDRLAKQCEEDSAPRFVWRMLERLDGDWASGKTEDSSFGGAIRLVGCGLDLPGEDIRAHLEGAKHVVLFAVTLGAAWQRTFEQLNATSPTDALVYDACASAATEAAGEAVHGMLADAARVNGLEARARFSPGYGDLPLSIHPAFLEALDANRTVGVFATESNLLAPAKSITAVVGLFAPEAPERIGDKEDEGKVSVRLVPNADKQCRACAAFEYCNFRENGKTCHG